MRDYTPTDLPEVQRLHEAMGLDYKMPDLGNPLHVITKVALLDDKIVAVGTMRIEAELMLWIDHEAGTPEMRWEAVQRLNDAGMEEAYWNKGIDNAVMWVPREVEKSFAKRLHQMGFLPDREGWHSWSRRTKHE